ncbi:MAG: esterase [Bacteroidales bacterium]|nr:esterase [Bacteroidales bacterium]
MELYEYAAPGLMAGKKVLYVHGFASSGQTGSVHTLRLLLPDAAVIAPDLPVEPDEAMALLRDVVNNEKPDLIIGTSMGGMYTEMLYGIDRIIVNPAFQLADTILKNNGLGRREFHNIRADGETSFLVTKTLLEHFREVSSHCFEKAGEDRARVFGLFGTRDNMVHTFDLFHDHYPQAIRFDGEHHLNDSVIVHSLLPVIRWIDDRQNGVSRPVISISLSDKLVNHSSGMRGAVETLCRSYDVHILSSVDYNCPGKCEEVFHWCESNLGVPVWNRVGICNHKGLVLADYLIDAEPELNGGQDFMGTLVHFGSDDFKTWEDVLTFFSRLGGQ